MAGIEVVISLACVSNDHSCQLDEALSTSINYDAFEPLVVAAKIAGVRRFIYCSSSSVYGISDAPDVREDHPLLPLTLYNKYKGMCEPLLRKHRAPNFEVVIIRPATVCGYAPRQRFDLTVNIMTMLAVLKREITVFGGEQRRPNLHINDMVRCYRTLIDAPVAKIDGETFNVGRQNLKVAEIANIVATVVYREMGFLPNIVTTESTDTRSYHINSDKIARVLGFEPRFTVEDAVRDLCHKFKAGMFKDALENPVYTNVKQLQEKGFAVADPLASYRTDRYANRIS
jgi:nucleoside-diphosphate-sugar epimerase